jgi:SNF2 family DNA or RNA helicase
MLTGAVDPRERQRNVEAFNTGEIQFLLITLGAGGEGLSLKGSSTCIFLQRSFSAIKNAQAEDRLHGIGRGVEGQALEIIDIISADTAESRVHEARVTKAARLEEIVRDADTLKNWLAK